MTSMKQKVLALTFAAAFAMAPAVQAADGVFTLAPGENRSVYQFGNLSGSIDIVTDMPITVRWIHTGEKKEAKQVTGSIELALPKKTDGSLEASNPNPIPVTVRVTERTKASNLAQVWENFWGTAAGGKDSEINKAHRAVKDAVKSAGKKLGIKI